MEINRYGICLYVNPTVWIMGVIVNLNGRLVQGRTALFANVKGEFSKIIIVGISATLSRWSRERDLSQGRFLVFYQKPPARYFPALGSLIIRL